MSVFSPDLMFTKYETDLLCINITYMYISTKGICNRVSLVVFMGVHIRPVVINYTLRVFTLGLD